MKYLAAILFVALAAQAHATLNCYYCENCANPFETANAPTRLCRAEPEPEVPNPTGLPEMEVPPTEQPGTGPIVPGPPGMEVPQTEQPGTGPIVPGPPGMEVPQTELPIAPAVLHVQELRQKRETTPAETVYNCFTVTEGENTRRGCVAYQGSRDATCQSLSTVEGKQCTLCTGELCNNSASGFTISLVTLLAASVLALKF